MATKKQKTTKKKSNNTAKKQKNNFKDEIIILIVIAISMLLFVSIYTNKAGVVGSSINKIIFGLVGITAFAIPFYMIGITIFKLANKKNKFANRKIVFSSIVLFVATIVAQIIQGNNKTGIFEGLTTYFSKSAELKEGGGLIGGFFADILLELFGRWGTYIVLGVVFVVLMVLLTEKSFIKLVKKISAYLYNKFNSYTKKHNKKTKQQKPNSTKEDNSFTIQSFQDDQDLTKGKEFTYASKDDSNMLDRVTIPAGEQGEQLTFVGNEKNETVSKEQKEDELPLEINQVKKESDYTYEFPPIELLKKNKNYRGVNSKKVIIENANKLQQTLENFGVKVNILNVSYGPTVTRYELQPEQGVKVSKIVNLMDDIKLNLAAPDIRIEAPIPGKAAVGIEVPNKDNQAVLLRDIIESEEFKKHPSDIAFAIGKDIGGQVIVTDISKMPHMLIAGATGSGKSVCINTLITSIIYKAKPSEVKLIMIDPKMVELSVYNGIPHLLIPVVTDPKKASSALSWAVAEMTDRYKKFAEYNVRDLKGYNKKVKELEDVEQLPQIVLIVDELSDLMMVAPGDVEDAICRLAQMARAAGIHLVIATQRPSVNVITGLIKANIPSRISFAVSSGTDSRTIIDMNGAEKLLGKGDMLFYPVGYNKPLRVQGAFISDKEVSNIVEFVKNNQEELNYNENVIEQISQPSVSQTRIQEERDEYFEEAKKLVIEKQKASISMLQRTFRVGFNRAARLMEQLNQAGVVGPDQGSKPRKVLISQEELMNDNQES